MEKDDDEETLLNEVQGKTWNRIGQAFRAQASRKWMRTARVEIGYCTASAVCMGEGLVVPLSSNDSALYALYHYHTNVCLGIMCSKMAGRKSPDIVSGMQMVLATQLIGGYEPLPFLPFDAHLLNACTILVCVLKYETVHSLVWCEYRHDRG